MLWIWVSFRVRVAPLPPVSFGIRSKPRLGRDSWANHSGQVNVCRSRVEMNKQAQEQQRLKNSRGSGKTLKMMSADPRSFRFIIIPTQQYWQGTVCFNDDVALERRVERNEVPVDLPGGQFRRT